MYNYYFTESEICCNVFKFKAKFSFNGLQQQINLHENNTRHSMDVKSFVAKYFLFWELYFFTNYQLLSAYIVLKNVHMFTDHMLWKGISDS